MQQYYQVNIFNDYGRFKEEDLSAMLEKGRKHFFIFFPRKVRLEEIIYFSKFCEDHPGLFFCIHDKNLLTNENEYPIGRNLSFYLMLSRNGVNIESISYHLGAIKGYGWKAQSKLIKELTAIKAHSEQVKTRYLCATFDEEDYRHQISFSLGYLRNIVRLAHEENIHIVIKNLCVDYCLTDLSGKNHFAMLGYKVKPINEEIGKVPVLLEKGDFPRHIKEMAVFEKEMAVGFALDIEFLRYSVALSKRYNIQNSAMMELWDIKIKGEGREMLEKYGFIIEKGKPIFYEKELDLYDLIFHLKGKVDIAHLSGSIGPVFVDKKFLTEEDVNNDLLLGIIKQEDIPHASLGRDQLAAFDGYNDVSQARNFKYDAPQRIWETMFKKQFLEDIYLLKEIGCKKIIQKMKSFSENATQTFEMYNNITDISIEEEGSVL